jgi:crotonyl-CoA carboxylase/reductase
MFAQVVRQDRFGDPRKAFQVERIDVPQIKAHEVLIGVMAAGINYNNVWAARGIPIDVIRVRQKMGEPYDFHIGGSDVSGIVYATGDAVEDVAIGDEVVIHHGYWDPDDHWIKAGKDPMLAPSARVWGYNTNFGSFAQFCVAQAHQVLPKAPHLSWEEAAAPTLVGTTAYRMLFGWEGNVLKEGDVVLVWGGSGGLGGQAIQLAKRSCQMMNVVNTARRWVPWATLIVVSSHIGAFHRIGPMLPAKRSGQAGAELLVKRSGTHSASDAILTLSSSIRVKRRFRRVSLSVKRAAWSSSARGQPATQLV